MALPRYFTSRYNFGLAFTRVVRGANKDYKLYYRHLFPPYQVALRENLADLIDDLRRGAYLPSPPTMIYQPKRSGVLRPLALLSLRDLIVYQAIVNVVADKTSREQTNYARKQSFGNIFAGRTSPFFFRSWKRSYRLYMEAMEDAFDDGYTCVADFDLVSCYELLDHNLLCSAIEPHVRNRDLLDLLKGCLSAWTTNASSSHLRHGVPQGPEASAYLAECMLLRFDAMKFKDVKYLRYVDDIRLMAKSTVPLRRGLLKLDLASKDLGLVPQAQKIGVRKIHTFADLRKSIPSGLAHAQTRGRTPPQRELLTTLRRSLRKKNRRWHVDDPTNFKYALLRLNPRREILSRVSSILAERPDLSWVLSMYLRKFPEDREAADVLLRILQLDPTYDASAAHCIEALDVCEPPTKNTQLQADHCTRSAKIRRAHDYASDCRADFSGQACWPEGCNQAGRG